MKHSIFFTSAIPCVYFSFQVVYIYHKQEPPEPILVEQQKSQISSQVNTYPPLFCLLWVNQFWVQTTKSLWIPCILTFWISIYFRDVVKYLTKIHADNIHCPTYFICIYVPPQKSNQVCKTRPSLNKAMLSIHNLPILIQMRVNPIPANPLQPLPYHWCEAHHSINSWVISISLF